MMTDLGTVEAEITPDETVELATMIVVETDEAEMMVYSNMVVSLMADADDISVTAVDGSVSEELAAAEIVLMEVAIMFEPLCDNVSMIVETRIGEVVV
jgi:hypothetical protein